MEREYGTLSIANSRRNNKSRCSRALHSTRAQGCATYGRTRRYGGWFAIRIGFGGKKVKCFGNK